MVLFSPISSLNRPLNYKVCHSFGSRHGNLRTSSVSIKSSSKRLTNKIQNPVCRSKKPKLRISLKADCTQMFCKNLSSFLHFISFKSGHDFRPLEVKYSSRIARRLLVKCIYLGQVRETKSQDSNGFETVYIFFWIFIYHILVFVCFTG